MTIEGRIFTLLRALSIACRRMGMADDERRRIVMKTADRMLADIGIFADDDDPDFNWHDGRWTELNHDEA